MKLILKTFKPHPKQIEVMKDDHRYKVVVCGRRFGKTTMAVNEMIKFALSKPKRCVWYVAPTYKQAKMIAWRLLTEYTPKALVHKINEADLRVEFKNNSYIELKGADTQADTLRGVRIDFIIMDEYAFMKPSIFEEIIRGALTDSGGGAWFVGTPKGYNHFYEMYRDAVNKTDFARFRFTSYDNPYLKKDEIDKAKEEISDDAFHQEYLAEFKKHAGLVYPDFSQDTHVMPIQQPSPDWVCYRSIDFGQVNPTCVLYIGADKNDNIYVFDEIYESNLSTEQLAHLIKAKNPTNYFARTFGDASAAQSIKDLSDTYGIYVYPVKKTTGSRFDNYVMSGIERVRAKLKIQEGTGRPKLFVASHCVNTINEFESYAYPEVQSSDDIRNPQEKPEKAFDHAMDALRYFIMEYIRPMEKIKLPEFKPSNRFTGY